MRSDEDDYPMMPADAPNPFDKRFTGRAGLSQRESYEAALRGLTTKQHPVALRDEFGPYAVWLAQRQLETGSAENPDTLRELRTRVQNHLLYEGEYADEARDRVSALGRLLTSIDQRELVAARLAGRDASDTEDAVRAELRDPSPRLIQIMIEEWAGGLPGSAEITVGLDGAPPRPPIGELVRRLLPHWEDVLREEGWVRALP